MTETKPQVSLGIRFDFRNPAFAGTTMSERYVAALDMVEWADNVGFSNAGLSEHHGSADGYLPSALAMAAAFAARSKKMAIVIAAIVTSCHDPLSLAEQVAVVDNISGGRLVLGLVNGYVGSEFAMFDRPINQRPKTTSEVVKTLREAFTGEPFEFRGRTVRVTPPPHQKPGPPILLGGTTEPAARRAARLGDGFMPANPTIWDAYRDELVKIGKPDPGPMAASGGTSFFHIATDVDKGWDAIAPYAMHEANAYGEWMAEAGLAGVDVGGYAMAPDPDTLKATGQYRVVTPEDLLAELQASAPTSLGFHPMMGGIPPEMAWESLRLFESKVLPHITPV